MKNLSPIVKASFLFIIIMVLDSCAVNPVTGKKQVMLMTESQEVEMGAQYDPQVIATFGEYKNDQLLAFLQARADEMGRISHRSNIKYHVRLLDSPVVNAFAVPGGYIYFTRGILAHFNNEAELVGVLGHEMGHVTARHSASQQSKQQIGQLLLIGGMIASEKFAQYAEYAMQGMQLLFLKFSRDDETQSDRLGVAYSSGIGYDAHKMADFFRVLERMNMAEGQGGVPTFLSTHPDPGDRFNKVHDQAKKWQDSLKLSAYKVNNEQYLAMIDGITYGEDPKQGYVEGNAFYHPVMKFRFPVPAGWQLQNQPTQVNMAPTDGKALMVFTIAQGKTLEEAAENTLKQLQIKLQESKSGSVNGMPALITLSKQTAQDQSTGQSQTNLIMSGFINYNNTIYVFHGVTAESDYNTYGPVFSSTMGEFSKLSDPSKINVRPKVISIRKAGRNGTFAETLESMGVPRQQMDELAILNNLELNSPVEAGKSIKIIGSGQ
jgi:predicted Zn-dependent protease